ncbi:MAG: BamA/TamA family outer membrane protein [Candidatus Marinimicrobia bacterium]|nr:BamA/TamA family outer membrane protein [Candidatus Neomarinimicrobiota bacterium]
MSFRTQVVAPSLAFLMMAGPLATPTSAQVENRTLASITFGGNFKFTDAELLALMKLRTGGLFDRQPFSRRALKIDAITLRNYYRSRGYLDTQVADSFAVNSAGQVDAFLSISEGTQYHLGTVNISGNRFLSTAEILSYLHLEIGAPYNPVALRYQRGALIDHYQDRGKLAADILLETEIGEVVALNLTVFEGPTFTIGRVLISGLVNVPERFLRRELIFKSGEQFNRALLVQSQQRVFESGLFGGVEITPVINRGMPEVADIEIKVRELDRRSIDLTLGFRQKAAASAGVPVNAFAVSGQWWHSRVFGSSVRMGITIEADMVLEDLSSPNLLLALKILSPWTAGFRAPTTLRLFSDYRTTPSPDWRTGIDLSLQSRRTRRNQWRGSFRWVFITAVDPSDAVDAEQDRSISGSYLHQGVDNLIEPHRGTIFQIEPSLHQTFLEGKPFYFKIESDLRRYHTLFQRGVFAYRLKGGYLTTFPSGTVLADIDRFEMGGSTSLRGWRAPKEFAPNGGTIQGLFNVEIRWPLVWRLGVELFFDAGGLYAYDDDQGALQHWETGMDVGAGGYLTTPLGPIRVDFAFPIEAGVASEYTILAAFLYLF